MSEIKFDCHKCGQSMAADEADRGKAINCPGCQWLVKIPGGKNAPQNLRTTAGHIGLLGSFALGLGFAGVLAGLVVAGFIFAGAALIGLGCFLKLLAQVYYIRAALERANEPAK